MPFLNTLQSYLDNVFLHNLGISCIIMLVSFLARPLFAKILLGWLRLLIKKTRSSIDEKMLDVLESPARFVAVVVGVYIISKTYFPFLRDGITTTLIITCLFWTLYVSITPLGTVLVKVSLRVNKSMLLWALRVCKIIIVFLGFSSILEIWGINVGAVLTGIGILGAAVALSTQSLFKNLIAGFLILSERRFFEGEWILVRGVVEGTVEKIGFRSTLLRRFDQAPVQVPNTQLADAPLVNFTRMRYRRIYWYIGLEYRTTTEQLRTVVTGIRNLIKGEDFVTTNGIANFVFVDKFNDSSIDIIIYCFTETTNWKQWLEIKEKLAFNIKALVEENAKANFAFPSQSIYIEKSGDFTPPIK